MKDIWNCINIVVLKPETSAENKLKIEINDQTIEDPQILANEFNNFFVEKIQKLSTGVDGTQFWCFPWFPANSLLRVILRYTV